MPHQCARVGSCPLPSQGLLSIPPTPCGASAVWQRRGHCGRKAGRDRSSWPGLRFASWNIATGWVSTWFQCTFPDLATSKPTLCRMWDRPCRQSGRSIGSCWIRCSPGGAHHVSICLRPTRTRSYQYSHHHSRTRGPDTWTPYQFRGRNGNGVCPPTIQDAAGGLEQNTDILQSVCHSHSTMNTVSVVDARPAPDVSGGPNATGTGRASSSRARGSTSRRGQRRQTLMALKSSRVETLRAIFMNKGHSRRAAEVMTRYLRESSRIVYEGDWKRFVTHCQNKGLNVFNVR